jgi:hypothetical protein
MLPPNDFFFACDDIPPITKPDDIERYELVLDNFSSPCEPAYFCIREYSIWRLFNKAFRMAARELVLKCKGKEWHRKHFCILCPTTRSSFTLTERPLNFPVDLRSYRVRKGLVTLEYYPVRFKPLRVTIRSTPEAFDSANSIRECFDIMGFDFFYFLFSLIEPEDRLSVTLLYQTYNANGDDSQTEGGNEIVSKKQDPKDDKRTKEGCCV